MTPMQIIIHTTAEVCDITVTDIKGYSRVKNYVRPRQMAMAIARDMTEKSLPDIGRCFGGRDYTTVLHSLRRVRELRITDPDFRQEYDHCRHLCREALRLHDKPEFVRHTPDFVFRSRRSGAIHSE